MKRHSIMLSSMAAIALVFACSNGDSSTTTTTGGTTGTTTTTVPDVYKKIYGATSITSDGTYITIKSTGQPDHKSIYFPIANAKYEDFSGTTFGGTTFKKNPNTISTTLAFTFKIPLNPKVATTHAATPMGVMGVALNGVALFNQYAAPNTPLTSEVMSFDQQRGHPAPQGIYHYHVEPIYLTALKGKEALMGFLLDGFPVYGPDENGAAVTGLDAYHGHTSATADYPNGIYHYHVTNSEPYINGSGYYGTPGTVTN